MTAAAFVEKWQGCQRNERAAAQEHFIDLCALVGADTPNAADPKGDWYAFEKGAEKIGGGDGFADVWKRGHFAWEYKGKRKNLVDAYRQLLLYREALENPPLLVVCDLERFEVHTNFTGTAKKMHPFTLDDLRNDSGRILRILRYVMFSPADLRPDVTPEQVTEEVAQHFAEWARRFQRRGHAPLEVARFLNRLLFCFFAESTGLLRGGIVSDILNGARGNPTIATDLFRDLFGKMAAKGGGFFGADHIQWFNGGLFRDSSVLPLEKEDLTALAEGAQSDWSSVEPAILGTLFERAMDPDKRSQLGAHYTDKASILSIIDPVVMVPLRREFSDVKNMYKPSISPTAGPRG
jgi:hypothetical protein